MFHRRRCATGLALRRFRFGDSAAFEVQWFSDAPLTQLVGSATVTNGEIEISGLTRGNQYWVRVRAVRADQPGPWSDQATRIAGI